LIPIETEIGAEGANIDIFTSSNLDPDYEASGWLTYARVVTDNTPAVGDSYSNKPSHSTLIYYPQI